MSCGKRSRNNLLWLLTCLIGLTLCACAPTYRAKAPVAEAASWDGNEHNSGLIGFDAAGNAIITWHAQSRYFDLCEQYGNRFRPMAYGNEPKITGTNTFLLDAQHFSYFATMNRWKKAGVK